MDLDPEQPFCPNLDCAASGQRGQGTRTSHGRKRPRYACSVCRTPFSARPGTPFYRRRTAAAVLTQVLTLVAMAVRFPPLRPPLGCKRARSKPGSPLRASPRSSASPPWSNSRATSSRSKPTRSGSSPSPGSSGWRWR